MDEPLLIPIDSKRWLLVDGKCRKFYVDNFQASLFVKNGYVYPSTDQTTKEMQAIVSKMEMRGETVTSDSLYEELVKETETNFREH